MGCSPQPPAAAIAALHPIPARRCDCYARQMPNHEPDPLPSTLKHLIVGQFRLDLPEPDKIPDHAPIIGGALGLDSLDALELALCLEEQYGITIQSQAESVHAFASIDSLTHFVGARLAAKAERASGQSAA